MATLGDIGAIETNGTRLRRLGLKWRHAGGSLPRKKDQTRIGKVFDKAIAEAVAVMLGGIPIATPNQNAITPAGPDCVELGPTRVAGGVRAQNFDVGYRPDGPRFVFDSKTLNSMSSVRANYQNMINDIATEATTVHTRFPYAVVAFLVAIPEPCLPDLQRAALIATLERLNGREGVDEPSHLAEAIALVLWDPETGEPHLGSPGRDAPLGMGTFARSIEQTYAGRYKGLPPHV